MVEINGTLKSNNNGFSTLFPSDWSDLRVMEEFSAGLASGSKRVGVSEFETVTPSGIKIFFVANESSGRIITFRPVLEND